eukprot:6032400-Pleurochrysis_carterae.AAC.2
MAPGRGRGGEGGAGSVGGTPARARVSAHGAPPLSPQGDATGAGVGRDARGRGGGGAAAGV